MLGRIIEIEGEERRLSLDRGFLSISGPDGLLGQVPLFTFHRWQGTGRGDFKADRTRRTCRR